MTSFIPKIVSEVIYDPLINMSNTGVILNKKQCDTIIRTVKALVEENEKLRAEEAATWQKMRVREDEISLASDVMDQLMGKPYD